MATGVLQETLMSRRDLFLIGPPLLLGLFLALADVRLVAENRRLSQTAHYYASLRHTPVGVQMPALRGKSPGGEDIEIDYSDRQTLLFVFSPTCQHCKRNWPAWLEIARAAAGKRVVFVNIGGPLPPDFSQSYSFGDAAVLAETSARSMIQYSLFESPLTVWVTPGGRVSKVWVGELSASEVKEATGAGVQGQ